MPGDKSMEKHRIGRAVKPYLDKAKDSALLAVEVYNKPAVKFKSSAYITLMVIAWTALFHAIFLRRRVKPHYKIEPVEDGLANVKHWDLAECVKRYWPKDTQNPVRKNIEMFIPLRNKVEHVYLPELDTIIFGECQALLLNFDSMLGEHFGSRNQLRESLTFSLQMFPSGSSFAQAVKDNKGIDDVKMFITNYRNMLGAGVMQSGQFAFKAFLIQVANHASVDALPIQFVQFDKLNPEERAKLEDLVSIVKVKTRNIQNADGFMAKAVVVAVQKAIDNPSVVRQGRTVPLFNLSTHTRCWKLFSVRPRHGASHPEATNEQYCLYDNAHKDYTYTQAWVDHLIEEWSKNDLRSKVCPPEIPQGPTPHLQ
jgi:hypothetical protein